MRGYPQLLDHASELARDAWTTVTIGTIGVRLVSKIAQKCAEPRVRK